MKTDAVKVVIEENKIVKSMEERVVLGARRSLHPLQKAAGDKENLVGAGRNITDMPPNKEKLLSTPSSINADTTDAKKLKTTNTFADSTAVTAEDLTSEETPSAAYWQQLCERQKAALDESLKENEELHDKIKILEEENEQCRILLEETKALVNTLTEIINDEGSEEE